MSKLQNMTNTNIGQKKKDHPLWFGAYQRYQPSRHGQTIVSIGVEGGSNHLLQCTLCHFQTGELKMHMLTMARNAQDIASPV